MLLQSLKDLSNLKKTLIVITIFNFLVIVINFVVIFLFGAQISNSIGWLLGSEEKTIFSNLLFVEGAFTIGIGALIAGGFSENKLTQTKAPSTAYSVEKISKQSAEFRQEQLSTGILIMLAGLPLIIMSVLSAII